MEKLKYYFNICKNYVKQNTITVILVLGLIGFIGYEKQDLIKETLNIDLVKELQAKGTVEQVADKRIESTIQPKCSKTEVEFILKNEDDLLKNREFVVIDLSTFKKTKVEVKHGKEYTYYSRFGAVDEFYTIAKIKAKE